MYIISLDKNIPVTDGGEHERVQKLPVVIVCGQREKSRYWLPEGRGQVAEGLIWEGILECT